MHTAILAALGLVAVFSISLLLLHLVMRPPMPPPDPESPEAGEPAWMPGAWDYLRTLAGGLILAALSLACLYLLCGVSR